MLDRRTPHALVLVFAAREQKVCALRVAEVARDLDRRLAHVRVFVGEQRHDARGRLGRAERVERADGRLPDGRVRVAHQPEQRLERAAVSDPRERVGGRDGQLRILFERADERGRGARVADAPEGDRRRAPDVEVFGVELFDQNVGHARAVPDERLDGLVAHVGAPEQARQGALDRRAFEPAEHERERAQVFGPARVERVEQVLRARGVD